MVKYSVNATDEAIDCEDTKLLGDYNGDHVVDAGDEVVWLYSPGTSNLQADGNDEGVVNQLDYAVWQSRVGTLTIDGILLA